MDKFVLPQLISTGLYNSRVVYKSLKYSRKRTTTLFEIELPIENMGKYFIDDKSRDASVDTILCVKPNQVRYTKLHYKCLYVHFMINEGILYDCLMSLPNFITVKNKEKYVNLLKNIDKYNQPGSKMDVVMAQSSLLELIYLLQKDAVYQAKSVSSDFGNRRVIEEAIKYINENLSSKLTLQIVSDKVSLSPVYFHKLFKMSTGLTLREYVEDLRIKKAADYIISTNKTLAEIAYECGFSSQSYFSYTFKRRMKQTPGSYVKNAYEKYDI